MNDLVFIFRNGEMPAVADFRKRFRAVFYFPDRCINSLIQMGDSDSHLLAGYGRCPGPSETMDVTGDGRSVHTEGFRQERFQQVDFF